MGWTQMGVRKLQGVTECVLPLSWGSTMTELIKLNALNEHKSVTRKLCLPEGIQREV